jgi:threonylcarbamoyladenosine tRNA methylthiotransferase MtaB
VKKVAFYTLGCKLNFSETSSIGRMFEEQGYSKVEFSDTPDVFILNTCSVTDNADKKCRKVVREAKAISPNSYIAIIGCYAQLKPMEISEIPGVDAVLGASEKFHLLELLDNFEKGETKVLATDIKEANTFNAAYSINDRTRTFLKVQDGCDYSCTFCTIPLARGKSRSDTIAHIVEEAIKIGNSGIKEVVLTGVNTGDFGIRNGERKELFIDLIKALDKVEVINRFRISSIEPNLLTDEIIDFVAASNRFAPHFHIPLQSGSDEMLKQMKRRYLSELYTKKVAKIRSLMPHASIGVDVIIGFPGETDELFKSTYQYLTELNISYLHVFTYSERPNTPAATMANPIPMDVRHERSKQLRNLSEKKKRKFYAENIDRHATVLFENDVEDGLMQGFTENYVRVIAKYDPVKINELIPIKMTGLNFDGLMEIQELSGTSA